MEKDIRKLMMISIKKIVLAYSGGLDTSVILKWLKETYLDAKLCFASSPGRVELLGF